MTTEARPQSKVLLDFCNPKIYNTSMENKERDELILYKSKIVLTGLFSLCALVGLVTYQLIFQDIKIQHSTSVLSIAGIFILSCIFLCLWSLYQFFFRKPILIINSDIFYSPKTGKISWNDIEKIGMKSVLLIMPHAYTRVPVVYFYLKTGKIITLNTTFYTLSTIEVLKVISKYHKIIHLEDGSEFTFSKF